MAEIGTTVMKYPALVSGPVDGHYDVTVPDVPDVPECIAMGHSVEDALASAEGVLQELAAIYATEGRELPQPSTAHLLELHI